MLLDREKLYNVLSIELLDSLISDFWEVLELSVDHSELLKLARLGLLSRKTSLLFIVVFDND